jgi:hypothetical protein
MEIIVSPTLLVYTNHITKGPIQFVWKVATVWWRGFFSDDFTDEIPRDSNRDSHTVTWHFHRRNYRWNHRQTCSVGDSIDKSLYIPTLPTLSSFVSPSSSPSSFPSHLSPPKLQPTTHSNSPLFSTQALKFLILSYVVTINIRSCGFYHFL